jgi:hypothetical protein
MNRHLTQRDLLFYVDGELPRRRARWIHAHLLACWSCRRELESLESDIRAIVDAQDGAFLPAMPRPVRPWAAFDEIAARSAASGWTLLAWLRRAGRHLGLEYPGSLRSATAAVAVASLIVTTLCLMPQRLSAEVVLQRMENAERARTSNSGAAVIFERLRVERTDLRTSAHRSVEVESWKAGDRSLWRGNIQDLQNRYRRRGLGSELPLSPEAGERWLRGLQSEAEVSRQGDTFEVESHGAAEGDDLRRVELRIRKGTWRLEDLQLTFSDSTFDIAELGEAVLTRDSLSPDLLAELEGTPVETSAAPPARPKRVPPQPVRETTPKEPPSISAVEEELSVQYRLHEIGADLSEPIELARAGRDVVIDARAATPARQIQLAQVFGNDPAVRVETQVDARRPTAATPPEVIRPAAEHNPNERVIAFFGGAQGEEAFARMALDADSPVLARLYALDQLAHRWPSDAELSASARQQLRSMVDDHARALAARLPELAQLLHPVMSQLCPSGAARVRANHPPKPWREAAHTGLTAGVSLDHDLRALFTTSTSVTTLGEACPSIDAALDTLSSSFNNFLSHP